MLEILELEKSFFRKNPHKVVFCIQLERTANKDILQFFINESLESTVVSNFRGRPSEAFKKNQSNLPEKSEELLCIFGECDQKQDFCYSLNTSFLKYNEQGEILHNLEKKAFGVLKPYESILNPRKVFNWMPLKITSFRYGIERYSEHFLGSMLGLVPKIDSRFYIEVKEESIWVLLEKDKSIFLDKTLRELDSLLREKKIFNGLIENLSKAV